MDMRPVFTVALCGFIFLGASWWIGKKFLLRKLAQKWLWVFAIIIASFDFLVGGISIWGGIQLLLWIFDSILRDGIHAGLIPVSIMILFGITLLFVATRLFIRLFKWKQTSFNKPVKWIGNQWVCNCCEQTNQSDMVFCESCGAPRIHQDRHKNKKQDQVVCPTCENASESTESFGSACQTPLKRLEADFVTLHDDMVTICCPYCDCENDKADRFCTQCGKELRVRTENKIASSQTETLIFCTECGARGSDDLSFCNACGAKLNK